MWCQTAKCSDNVVLWITAFILSGVASPMLLMQTRYVYDPPSSALWPLIPYYLGNLVAGAFSKNTSRAGWWQGTKLFGLDLCGQIFSNLGLLVIGPPLYAIFYKSVTVFTGLLSLVVLPPSSHPTRQQWAAMLLITFGLGIQGTDAWRTVGAKEVRGALLVVAGCLFFACGAVVGESYLGGHRPELAPLQAAWVIGIEGIVCSLVWTTKTLTLAKYGVGFWMFLLAMVVTNAGHQAAWFILVGRIGACTTAVLKAFQSACLFLTASAAFCSRDSLECLSWAKVASFAVVSVGMALYMYPVTRGEQQPQAAEAALATREGQEEEPLLGSHTSSAPEPVLT